MKPKLNQKAEKCVSGDQVYLISKGPISVSNPYPNPKPVNEGLFNQVFVELNIKFPTIEAL